MVKSLWQEAKVTYRFVTYLARKTLERVKQGKGCSPLPKTPEQRVHRQMMTVALAEMGLRWTDARTSCIDVADRVTCQRTSHCPINPPLTSSSFSRS